MAGRKLEIYPPPIISRNDVDQLECSPCPVTAPPPTHHPPT